MSDAGDRPWHRRDDGATIVLVALFAFAMVGMAALVVDLGNGWRTRRALIPGTDAAALAAAQDYVNGVSAPTPCAVTAPDYLGQNAPSAVLDSCVPGGTLDHGWVTVTATDNVQTWFAGAIGSGDYTVESVSSALFAPPATVTGLQPIGLCIDAPGLRNLIQNPPSSSTLIRIDYDKGDPNDCGGPSHPSNWGMIDFDGGSFSFATISQWILGGYPGEVIFDDDVPSSCSGGDPHCYPGELLPLLWVDDAIDDMQAGGAYHPWPVYDFVDTGGTPEFHLVAIIRARMVDHRLVTTDPSVRFIQFRVDPGLVAGTCCGSLDGAAGNKIVAICGVDPAEISACEP